jgi:Acetyltransferase (GNAT) domain
VDSDGSRLDEFLHVYTETMKRRNADRYYYFSRAFFETLIRSIPGLFVFSHVVHQGRVVASELVLLSRNHAYFFLGGTLADAFELRRIGTKVHDPAVAAKLVEDRRRCEQAHGRCWEPEPGFFPPYRSPANR